MIIARDKEIFWLKQALSSDKSEFVAVYGRRRVGNGTLDLSPCPLVPLSPVPKRAADYRWSSWSQDYLNQDPDIFPTANTRAILSRYTLAELTELIDSRLPDDLCCLEDDEFKRKTTDDDIRSFLREHYDITYAPNINRLPLEQRKQILRELLNLGAGVRQLQRVTGVGKNIISKQNQIDQRDT